MRILFILPAAKGVYTPEAAERRINLIKSYATSSITIDVDYLPEPSAFLPWSSGGGSTHHRSKENLQRTHELGARRAAQADKEGYDAFCPFGGVDTGVEAARKLGVKIPMSGPAEASVLLCGMIGRPFASCSYMPRNEQDADKDRYRELYRSLRVKDLHVAETAIGISNTEYPQRHDEVLDRYKTCVTEARQKGAEIMGFLMGSICPTEFTARQLLDATGMHAIDGIAAQIIMVELWHRTGLPQHLVKMPR